MKRYSLATPVCLALLLAVASCRCMSSDTASQRPLALLGAFDQEVAMLEARVEGVERREIQGIAFTSGRLGDRSVVIASTGVGKVNAAMTTTLLIEHFRPAQVILSGIAGGVDPSLEPGDIVIGSRTAHHDMGMLWSDGVEHGGVRNRLTGEDNPVFFPADPMLLAAAYCAADRTPFESVALKTGGRPPHIHVGTIVTGDTFVASEEKCREFRDKLDADAVEMEGAAVAQVCYQRGIGCLVIRSIADKADESAVVDKQTFYEMAARNSASLVAVMVECLERL